MKHCSVVVVIVVLTFRSNGRYHQKDKVRKKIFGVCVCVCGVPLACVNVIQNIRVHWSQVNIISLAQNTM